MPPIEIERARRPLGGQLRHHLARHGVAARLIVDGDDGDVRAVRLDADVHGRAPRSAGEARHDDDLAVRLAVGQETDGLGALLER